MALDQDVKAVLDLLDQLGMQDFSTLTVEQARTTSLTPPPETPTAVGAVEDLSVPGQATDIPIRRYRPSGDGTTGALIYFHGGGWVIGGLDSHDETCRHLCARSGVQVISVDYRLAPEHRFPAAFDDCYEVTRWAHDNAAQLGIDAGRIGVGGDSAGGNLAAAVALKARDEGLALACQLLVYPVTSARIDTPSYQENAEGYLLTKNAMIWFWDHYVPEAADRQNPLAAPIEASSCADLAPALVQTAEFDPLRDEGEAYAARLKEEGSTVSTTRYDGVIHGFFGMVGGVAKADTAVQEAADFISKHLG